MVNPRCYLDITIRGEREGRIVLYSDLVTKMVEKLNALCELVRRVLDLTWVSLYTTSLLPVPRQIPFATKWRLQAFHTTLAVNQNHFGIQVISGL
ncbi:hypothetical protein Syun_001288 [Stephania yunnanensis]|uniref:Uncharacterized protein n=1 Tax=Stephania yunnanensis TaxID=152371 RepID=A0AAP0Q6Y8_9MAGN